MLAKRTIPKASMCDIYREFKGTTTTNIANYFRIKFRTTSNPITNIKKHSQDP
jgi:hypothetical protein